MAFGLSCSTASLAELLEEVLQKAYYTILPMGGVMRSVLRGLRMLNIGFGGIGCPHPGIECLIKQLNKLTMHYGCPSRIGTALQTSMEYFILELGLMATLPFSFAYNKYKRLVTHCWLKTLWEKCDAYKIRVAIKNVKKQPPQEGNMWFNQALIEEGYSADQICQLNRVRIHQHVLYLLDVLGANGRSVDLKYTPERLCSPWSTYLFPSEQPT